MPKDRAPTRIQKKNRAAILEAALNVFSAHGFRGSTVDQIAAEAGLSKPNLLYYFPSKEAIHTELLSGLLETWLAPLHDLDQDGDPMEEILAYIRRKLQMSQELPRESRLFANELVQGAPRIHEALSKDLKELVDEKTVILTRWMDQGKIARVHPYHLMFSIWALTQHYADFEVQVRAILGEEDPFEGADPFVDTLYRKLLTP
ncbi:MULTISPECIES: TetR family transcriptional regulator C-terminal domain-containing protein [unclassified Ruegeria]|uniref:TetR family transcriptional regulator C-terminal domain-containing protein n=1 Tax=unclassified Ruegeria TaxID=2625375 RepID=UPI00148925B2|nr:MULTISPECIES: TetR family transcriptional regulator C-terminal domain-containing protein [unclassified Ruegeria]NOD63619.1 TetR family transcriptional regulator [Ruegeria sp. HKCCD6109]NOD75126.1 TetR family transcriptional regulator [Ruegeria sp. HKCCD4332]NOD87087.1 TetR family transcriptional regulator [Ruegeria sp. HKCCD4318]NOD91199.1 TetR family transcriptional regulator [Ruegeria sp. HKCCD4884]NOE12642.1 TetR family transcriptional regulator [Ruegeria sp. HKCCD4318-2]